MKNQAAFFIYIYIIYANFCTYSRLINKTPSLGNYVVPDSIKIFENLFSVECFLNKNEAQKIFCIVMYIYVIYIIPMYVIHAYAVIEMFQICILQAKSVVP